MSAGVERYDMVTKQYVPEWSDAQREKRRAGASSAQDEEGSTMTKTNHPNRSAVATSAAATPAPEAIRSLRESAKLTQTQAGELVFAGLRTWQQWEKGERRMHPGLWQLFTLKLSMGAGAAR